MKMSILRTDQTEALTLANIRFEGLHRIGTIGDGSCFFHSLLRAFNIEYIKGKTRKRQKLIAELRASLAVILPSKYAALAAGELKELGTQLREYSLPAIKKHLKTPSESTNEILIEYVSDMLDKDIYIVNYTTGDVYPTAAGSWHKGRNSVVILYLETASHYELVGTPEGYLFKPTHPLIQLLHSRLYPE